MAMLAGVNIPDSQRVEIGLTAISGIGRSISKKIITDLDIFYSHYYNNINISITGTNGKSTTAKILFDILKEQKKDVRLVGNIGNAILNEKKMIFILYQILLIHLLKH